MSFWDLLLCIKDTQRLKPSGIDPNIILSVEFFVDVLYQVEKVPSIPVFLRGFFFKS